MYKGFIIDDFDNNSDFSNLCSRSTTEILRFSNLTESDYLINESFNSSLKDFIIQDSVDRDVILDGQKIIDNYFPEVHADIFISHSHRDVQKVQDFAKTIYHKTGLVSFIDSEVWKYADDLLRQIDDACCPNFDGTYSYEKRNVSTAYVHMMLNTALLSMIDRCECLFFLSTPNSYNTDEEIENTTFSPWIYSELSMANTIEKKMPARFTDIEKSLLEQSVEQFFQEDSAPELKIALKPKTENLIECSGLQIKYWLSSCEVSKKLENLDVLYNIFKTPKKGVIGRMYG